MSSDIEMRIGMKISQSDPKTPFIVFIDNAKYSVSDGDKLPKNVQRFRLLNSAIFLKSEFAKKSLRIIESCYEKSAQTLEDGNIEIRPMEFFPALREIDSLIFELGSILDFFAREVNIVFTLGIGLRDVGFGTVVKKLQEKHPHESITEALVRFDNSDCHQYFRKMRNRITHRLPFVVRGKIGEKNRILFPDDPENDDVVPITKEDIDILETCKKWVYEILAFVDQTSIIVFQKMGEVTAINIETGEKIDIESHFGRNDSSTPAS